MIQSNIECAPRPKIALIIDSESWAFSNIAKQLVRNLGGHFDFKIIPAEIVDNIVQILIMTADCAVTHFFWRDFLFSVKADPARRYARELGFRSFSGFLESQVHNRKITMSIYDHLFLTRTEINERSRLFNELVSGYTVSSQQLLDIYKHIDVFPDPDVLAEDGVDFNLFRPLRLDRLESLGRRPMVIGWAGNSKWASERGDDFKGLHTILKPAVTQLRSEGLDIRLALADRQQILIPHEQMDAYYAKLDLYVCPSKMEGTPNPVLEAMACGVPVISTNVGVVPQLFDGDPFRMILPKRDVPTLKRFIRAYHEGGAGLAKQISEYGLKKITSWDWNKKADNFKLFFNRILKENHEHGSAAGL